MKNTASGKKELLMQCWVSGLSPRLQKRPVEINNFRPEPDKYQVNRLSKKIQSSIKINDRFCIKFT